MLRAVVLLAVVCLAWPVGAAFGHNKVTESFDAEVSKHFLGSAKVSYARRKAKKQNKPLIVLLTKPGCGACQNLKQSVRLQSGPCSLRAHNSGKLHADVPASRSTTATK
jgi:thioredoxin-related protein